MPIRAPRAISRAVHPAVRPAASPAVHRALLPRLLAFLVVLTPAAAEEATRDEWHFVVIEGKRAGYMRIQSRPRAEGGWVTTTTERLVLRRGAAVVDTQVSNAQEEDASGKLRGFRYVQKLAKDAMESVGEVRDGSLVITDTVGGKEPRVSAVRLDPSAVGPRRAEELLRSTLRKPGDSVESTLYFPETRKFGKQKSVLGQAGTAECDGTRRELRRVRVTVDVLPDVASEEWVDEEFRTWRSELALFGLRIVTCRADVSDVLAEDFSSPPEIFLASSIPVSRAVPPDARKVTYRIRAKGATFPVGEGSRLFAGGRQKLVREEGPRTRILEVSRVAPVEGVRRPIAPTPELVEHLRPSSYIQSDDPTIVALAREAMRGEGDAWKAACALESWVHGNIRRKDLETAFATASEVVARREGDCTEHGVLLAALLRAAGMPSRVVAGLLYHRGAFVGHMWTEVWVGEWVPLDATLGRGSVGPDHIALAASSLDASSVASFFVEMVPVLGNLEIEVLEVAE